MTNEQPEGEATVWFVNGTHVHVDVYVNYHDEPEVSDLKPLELGPDVTFGDSDRPYGTYTFEAREKGSADNPVLAAGSLVVEDSQSYHAAFHRVGADEYRFSTYRNDFSPSAETRLEVRHLAFPPEIEWRATPAPESDPRIEPDERRGTLARGEWQQALDLVENQYFFEVLVDGERGAYQQTVEQELDKALVVHVVGDTNPGHDEEEATRRVLVDEFQIETVDAERNPVVTAAEPALSSEDTNRRVEMDCPPAVGYETNATRAGVSAVDPDGIVTGMEIVAIDPDDGDFEIPDDSGLAVGAIGDTATAEVVSGEDNSPGTYTVTLRCNPESLGERAECDLAFEVKALTVERLETLVAEYETADEVHADTAARFYDLLDRTRAAVESDDDDTVCRVLEDVVELAADEKDNSIGEEASDDLKTEAEQLRDNFDCG